MKIYTKTGDAGQTGLFSGRRLSKAELRVEAYGTVDELNAFVGLLRDYCKKPEEVRKFLLTQQHHLFDLGAILADDRPDAPQRLTISAAEKLEQEIDRMNAELPELRHFVLPGGHPSVSYAHVCRTVCRRAERRVVALRDEENDIPALAVTYLNRLSDYFFVLGRYLALKNEAEEIKWEPES
ncbi:ATP:cob(I)alamin adenosyltransferase [Lewinellaceae bacterium SD302]|nr:ATP:cob(I)alamin adenosyltransferase [Lewinellaceae bacterium SD302]